MTIFSQCRIAFEVFRNIWELFLNAGLMEIIQWVLGPGSISYSTKSTETKRKGKPERNTIIVTWHIQTCSTPKALWTPSPTEPMRKSVDTHMHACMHACTHMHAHTHACMHACMHGHRHKGNYYSISSIN